MVVEFSETVIRAQNDDRKSYDQLKFWAADDEYSKKEEAAAAYRTIMDGFSSGIYMSRSVP